jgi:hypothetical protein
MKVSKSAAKQKLLILVIIGTTTGTAQTVTQSSAPAKKSAYTVQGKREEEIRFRVVPSNQGSSKKQTEDSSELLSRSLVRLLLFYATSLCP